MSLSDDDNASPRSKAALFLFADLVDSAIVDVASEYHRIKTFDIDHNFEHEEEEVRLSLQARDSISELGSNSESYGKYAVDIYGQTHKPVANDIFECMKCGRSIMAGRFAPHLEKCMGKGRRAGLKATRSTTAQTRRSRATSASSRTHDFEDGDYSS